MTVESYASEIGLTVEEVLELCEALGISVDDKDTLLSTDDVNILNNNLSISNFDNVSSIPNTDVSSAFSPNYEPQIDYNLEDIYFGNNAMENIINKFETLKLALNSVEIGDCKLVTASNLETAKSKISSLLSGSVAEIGNRMAAVKMKIEMTNPAAAFVFEMYDIFYKTDHNIEYANYLDMENGTINPELFDDMIPFDDTISFDETTSVANNEFWNNFQSFLNLDGSINEDKINKYLQDHPDVNCAEKCINFYQSIFNGVTEQYESLKANQEFINEWEKGSYVDELGNLNYDLINKYKENNSNTIFVDRIVSNYESYLKQAGQLDLYGINNTSTGKFGQFNLTNVSELSILDNVYGEIPISEDLIYIGGNVTKTDILFNIERAYAEAAIDVYSSLISIAGINSERCKGLVDNQKKLVDVTINYLQEKQKIIDDQFESSVRPILNYDVQLEEIWKNPNAQEYQNILDLMRGNEISIVQLNRYFKENESYEIFSSSGDLITFTREDFEGFVQILDKHVQEETGNTYSQIITKQNEIVTLISTLKSSKYRIRQIEKELPYMEIAESDEYSKYLENIQDEHSIKLDFRANGEDNETIYIIDGQEETDINPLMIAKLIEDGKLDKFYGINFQYSDAYNNYKYLSDNNKNMYNYLYETKGLQVAEEYLKAIEDSINQKKGLAEAEEFLNSIRDENGKIETSFLNHLKSGGEGTLDGMKKFFDGLGDIFKTEGMMSSTQYKEMQILQELSSIDKSIIDNFYELGTSFGNMLPSMVLGAVTTPLIGSIAMGASSFGNSKNQALVEGNDLLRSTAYGFLSGVSETTLGYFLGNMPGMSQIAKFTVGDIFKEGVEEFIQEYVDAGLRSVLLNETIDAEQLMGDAGKSFLYGILLSAGTNGATTVDKAVCNIRINGKTVSINDVNSFFDFVSLVNKGDISVQQTDTGKSLFVISEDANIESKLDKITELFPNVPLFSESDKNLELYKNDSLKSYKALAVNAIDGLNSFFNYYNNDSHNYGANQGFLDVLYRYEKRNGQLVKIASDEYFRLKNKLIKQGFTRHGASMVMSGLDSVGACSYASIVNGIFSSFRNNHIGFKQIFGYEMTANINGKKVLNTGELLLDLYTFTNNTQNGGKLFKTNVDGTIDVVQISSTTDIFGRAKLEADNQQYMSGGYGIKENLITSFLKSKSSLLSAKTEKLFDHFNSIYLNDVRMIEIANKITDSLNANYNIGLGIYRSKSAIRMISLSSDIPSTSTFTWNEGSGHAVFVTGVDNRGFIVSSWGNKYLIPFSDLQSGSFVISRWNIDGLTQMNQRDQLLDNSFISAWTSQTKKYGLDNAIDSFQKFLDTGNFNYITRDENARNLLMKFSIDEIRNFVRVNNNGSLSIRTMVYGKGYK